MWKEELGADEEFYHRNLKKIIPRLQQIPPKAYSKHVKSLINPEIDEVVHAIMSDLVQSIGEKLKVKKQYEFPKQSAFYKPKELDEEKKYDIYYPGSGSSTPLWVTELTDYGLFEKEVNLCYSKMSKAGWVRYGREHNKEGTIYFIILALALRHPEIHPADGIDKGDYDMCARGFEHYLTKCGNSVQEWARKEVDNEHKYNILLSKNSLPTWTASLIQRISDNLTLEFKCPCCGGSFSEVAILMQDIFPTIWELKGKALHKKLIEDEEEAKKAEKKTRPYKRILLINMFYSARFFENEMGMKLFRENSELQKIWHIPRMTWSDKWNLLTSLDENL